MTDATDRAANNTMHDNNHLELNSEKKSKQALRQIYLRQLMAASFVALIVIAIWAILWLVLPLSHTFTVWVLWFFLCLLTIILASSRTYIIVKKICISPIRTEDVEVWCHKPLALHLEKSMNGNIHGFFVFSRGDIDGDLNSIIQYQYLYDTGDGVVWNTIPTTNAKIYPTLTKEELPYIVHWHKYEYRESLLTEPPTRLSGHNYPHKKIASGYFIYVPEESIPNSFKLI